MTTITDQRPIIRLLLLVETLAFALATLVHAGLLIGGLQHEEARNAEAVIAAVLLLGLASTWLRPAWARVVGSLVQGFALFGTLVGIFTIVVGSGPRTVPDVGYHATIVGVLVGGLIFAIRMPSGGLRHGPGEQRDGPDPRRVLRLRLAALGMLVALIVAYSSGMLVTLPDSHPGYRPADYFGGIVVGMAWAVTDGLALGLHVVLGVVLMIAAVALALYAAGSGEPTAMVAAALGAVCVVFGGIAGSAVLNYGEGGPSLVMAALFALAVLCYGTLLYSLPGQPPASDAGGPPGRARRRRQSNG